MPDFTARALDEHQFWLQILGDHARFIFKALSHTEEKEIRRAYYFLHEFDRLLTQVGQGISREELRSFHNLIYQRVQQLKQFKLHLIRRQLEGPIGLSLAPSLVSHMVNELEEYQIILGFLCKEEDVPLFHPSHHHLLWLLDAAGHADVIFTSLDASEKTLRGQSLCFTKEFEGFYLQANEIAGFTRAVSNYPRLTAFNQETVEQMGRFIQFLEQIQGMVQDKTLLGMIDPLMPDHMRREENYYLTKLTTVTAKRMGPIKA